MKLNLWIAAVFGIILTTFTVTVANAHILPTKEDCIDLWNVVGGQGDVLDTLRRVAIKGMDANTIVHLYEYCLRSEEGIRYRRSSGKADPSAAVMFGAQANLNDAHIESSINRLNRLVQPNGEQNILNRKLSKLEKFLALNNVSNRK